MTNKNSFVIAVDGYASSGKSTLAKDLARELNIIYIYKLLRSSNTYRNNGERIAAIIFFMCWVERFSPNFN